MTEHMMHMATMGLLVAIVAPTLLLVLIRAVPQLDRCTLPAAVALPGFVALHAAVTGYADRRPLAPLLDLATHAALLVGAMLF
jgi:hypothetical protein